MKMGNQAGPKLKPRVKLGQLPVLILQLGDYLNMPRSIIQENQSHQFTECNTTAMERRELLKLTGAGIGLVMTGGLASCKAQSRATRILKPGDKISLKADPEEIIQKAYDLGYKYEKEYRGCARCTVAALQDAVPFVNRSEELFRGSTCVDGGATPTNLASCGGFTGSGMVIAYVCGSTRDEKAFIGNTELAHSLIHKVHDRFVKAYGSVICSDVRKAMNSNCPEVVGRAAKWTAQLLIEEFT